VNRVGLVQVEVKAHHPAWKWLSFRLGLIVIEFLGQAF
jgi:hypothetical protein